MSWLFKSVSLFSSPKLYVYIFIYGVFISQSSIAAQLYEAAEKGNIVKVKKLLECASNEDINAQDTKNVRGMLFLMRCCVL